MAVAELRAIDRNQSLFAITDHLQDMLDTLDLIEDPALRTEAETEIDTFLSARIRKVDSITGYIAHCESQSDLAAAEIKRLQERKASYDRRIERIKASVQRVMDLWGMTKLEGQISTLQLRPCPPSVEVTDTALVPQDYKRIVVSETVDKTLAGRVLKAGTEIPGLRLITGRSSVVRK